MCLLCRWTVSCSFQSFGLWFTKKMLRFYFRILPIALHFWGKGWCFFPVSVQKSQSKIDHGFHETWNKTRTKSVPEYFFHAAAAALPFASAATPLFSAATATLPVLLIHSKGTRIQHKRFKHWKHKNKELQSCNFQVLCKGLGRGCITSPLVA